MLRSLLFTGLISGLALSLSACNYLMGDEGVFRDQSGDYLDAKIMPGMAIPQQLDSYTIDELYVIPAQLFAVAEELDVIPMPRPIETRRQEGVIIQSLNDRRWIVIDATPGQVWPLVRDYWTELQIILDFENPGTGIMETAWVEVENDRDTRHKYRVSIEPGLHSGYSEVYVTHMQNLRDDPIPIVLDCRLIRLFKSRCSTNKNARTMNNSYPREWETSKPNSSSISRPGNTLRTSITGTLM